MSFDWKNLTNASFKGVPFHVAIPNSNNQYGVESEEYTVERRLQFIKRPQVDGAPVRDWGADPETFVASIEFFGINHADTCKAFLAALDQGTPGTLILPTIPKAVNAYFWKRSRTTRHQEGNTIRVNVTWVAADAVTSPKVGQASGINAVIASIDQGAAQLTTDVLDAVSVLQNNPFLSAVNSLNSVVAQATSVVDAVLSLPAQVRNNIKTAQTDITSLLSTISTGIAAIQATFSPSAAATALIPSGQSLGTDSETGQTVVSFNEPDEPPPTPPPLPPPPAIAPTISVSTNGLDTASGVSNFGDTMAAALGSRRDSIASLSVGRCEDVYRALTTVLNSLSIYVSAVAAEAPSTYVVPLDTSLGEILFANGIDLSQLRVVHIANPQVLDPFVVPKGTEIVL